MGAEDSWKTVKDINPNASRSAISFYWLARSNQPQTGCSLRGRRFFRDFYFSETLEVGGIFDSDPRRPT
uniref:Uncharacterized protein n=1 Tax=Candidatus Kentrum sp. SD TaxID=2126332 RepID=A0A451BIG3_9GAMM|nr:MAG: hypothetical protein BECKSD772E_GA0070983_100328 [Candidatus Kentron sp. SD]VFK78090.1 MAG: hypothetical protein BECKSD772D_GA0070982_100645 [Candidatus Kentron sp. SD]